MTNKINLQKDFFKIIYILKLFKIVCVCVCVVFLCVFLCVCFFVGGFGRLFVC